MLKKILKDPLIHFMVMGAVIFGFFSLSQDELSVTAENVIEITEEDIERLARMWQKSWMRPPTEAELKGVVNQLVREEVLYREAKALSLDENDTIIRRRLAKKMEYLSSDLSASIEPTHEDLQAYYSEHQDKYKIPSITSFIQIYLSPDLRKDQIRTDADKLRTMLNQEGGEGKHNQLGDPSMLAPEYDQYTPNMVKRTFGEQFYEALETLPTGLWSGPLSSSYGLHLIYVRQKTEPLIADFDSVRNSVEKDWLTEHRKVTNNKFFNELRKRYKVVVAPYTKALTDEPGV